MTDNARELSMRETTASSCTPRPRAILHLTVEQNGVLTNAVHVMLHGPAEIPLGRRFRHRSIRSQKDADEGSGWTYSYEM